MFSLTNTVSIPWKALEVSNHFISLNGLNYCLKTKIFSL